MLKTSEIDPVSRKWDSAGDIQGGVRKKYSPDLEDAVLRPGKAPALCGASHKHMVLQGAQPLPPLCRAKLSSAVQPPSAALL